MAYYSIKITYAPSTKSNGPDWLFTTAWEGLVSKEFGKY